MLKEIITLPTFCVSLYLLRIFMNSDLGIIIYD
jgi:hypothetical protein